MYKYIFILYVYLDTHYICVYTCVYHIYMYASYIHEDIYSVLLGYRTCY